MQLKITISSLYVLFRSVYLESHKTHAESFCKRIFIYKSPFGLLSEECWVNLKWLMRFLSDSCPLLPLQYVSPITWETRTPFCRPRQLFQKGKRKRERESWIAIARYLSRVSDRGSVTILIWSEQVDILIHVLDWWSMLSNF